MRLRDFIDRERGPEAIVRLALCPLIFLLACEALSAFLHQLSGAGRLLMFLAFLAVSPVAYLIREARQGRRQRQVTRRGAERTPLLPPNEEDQ